MAEKIYRATFIPTHQENDIGSIACIAVDVVGGNEVDPNVLIRKIQKDIGKIINDVEMFVEVSQVIGLKDT